MIHVHSRLVETVSEVYFLYCSKQLFRTLVYSRLVITTTASPKRVSLPTNDTLLGDAIGTLVGGKWVREEMVVVVVRGVRRVAMQSPGERVSCRSW